MFRLAVLASGSGTNLQAIIDKLHRGGTATARSAKAAPGSSAPGSWQGAPTEASTAIEVALVVSDTWSAGALHRAEMAGIPTAIYPFADYPSPVDHDLAMAAAIKAAGADLIVMAGYMRLLAPAFLELFPWRVINLHPALLPSFPGTTSISDALRYGVKVAGVTVHFADSGMDTGPVILQEPVRVEDDDSVESLAVRIHAVEHELLPRAIELIAAGKVTPPATGSRMVRVTRE